MCRKLARLLRPHNDIHMSYSYYTVVYEMAVFSQFSAPLMDQVADKVTTASTSLFTLLRKI